MVNNNNEPYFCKKCKRMHNKGKIFDAHKEFNLKYDERIFSNKFKNTFDNLCQFISEDMIIPEESLKIQEYTSKALIEKIDKLIKKMYNRKTLKAQY